MEERLEALDKRRRYYAKWLERHVKAQEIAPIVEHALEVTEWEYEALRERPEVADEIPFPTPLEDYHRRNQVLWDSLPMLPEFYISDILTTSGSSAGSAMSTYGYIARVGDIEEPEAREYSQKHTLQYWQIQERQLRPSQVRNQIQRLRNPNTVERFDRAIDAYSATRFGGGTRTAAAAEMRTLLDGIKGDLWQRARRLPGEKMTCDIAADRLAKGEAEKTEIIIQFEERDRLYNRLSSILKDREGGSVTNLDHVWTQLLDHIYAVLNLIDLESR